MTELLPEDNKSTGASFLAKESSDVTPLDLDGDAILVFEEPETHKLIKFRVSTKVLSLASPVFAKLFGPDFQEGHKIRFNECPYIKLEDDDASAMEVILSVLHYRGINQLRSVDAESLATLAVHCDKYDCINALSAWISYWFNYLELATIAPEDLGFLLLAAYMFDDSKHFAEISARTLKELTPKFHLVWESHEILGLLPDFVQDKITVRINLLLRTLLNDLQTVETSLRQNKNGYEMPCLLCVKCGRTPPVGAKQCHPCSNFELQQKYCTHEYRIASYFAILTQVELWPSITPFQTCSVSDLTFRFTCAKRDLKHTCTAGLRCPLQRELEALRTKVNQVEESVVGFCLRCVKKGEWNTIQACECK